MEQILRQTNTRATSVDFHRFAVSYFIRIYAIRSQSGVF
jgi:hypothetical protein